MVSTHDATEPRLGSNTGAWRQTLDHRLLGHVLGHPGVTRHGIGQAEDPSLVAAGEGDRGRLLSHGHAGQEGLIGRFALGHTRLSHHGV